MNDGRGTVGGPIAIVPDVLIVADRERARSVTSALAETDEGLELDAVTTEDEAVDRIEAGTVDCIVSAAELPDGDGIELLERVRDVAPTVPVVLLADDEADVRRGLEAAATDVVESPLDGREARLLARRLRSYATHGTPSTATERFDEKVFRSVFEHSPDMISIHDEEGIIYDVNPRTCEKLGYDREEMIGMHVADVEVGSSRAELEEFWKEYDHDEPITIEGRNRRKDGTEFPVRVSLGRIDVEGRDWILAILRDVSELKARERELERYERIVENVPIGVYRIPSASGEGFELINPAMVSMFEADTEDELYERSLADLAVDAEAYEAFGERILEGDPVVEETLQFRTLEGNVIWAAVTAIRTKEGGDVYVDGIVQDVTERRKAETRLRKQEAHLRQAQAVADVGSWLKDVQEDEIAWSEEVYNIFGRSPEGGSLDHEEFLEHVHPDDREYVNRKWQEALEGEPYDIEHRIVVDGETRWVRERAEIIFDERGRPQKGIGVVQDVTDRKEYERRLEAQNEHLEVLNRVARHDIRNQMNVARGYAADLAESLEGERRRMAERIERAAEELLSISRKLRDVNGAITDDDERRPIDLGALVDDALESCLETHSDCECASSVPDSLWVQGTDRLRVALENVVENAIEHNDAEPPQIEITATSSLGGDYVDVRIVDDGPGIPEHEYEVLTGERERSQVEHASGLGLWTANWIVASAGGELRFDVDTPRGTVVTVRLPRADAPDP